MLGVTLSMYMMFTYLGAAICHPPAIPPLTPSPALRQSASALAKISFHAFQKALNTYCSAELLTIFTSSYQRVFIVLWLPAYGCNSPCATYNVCVCVQNTNTSLAQMLFVANV